jgi:transcription elongation regulator 1
VESGAATAAGEGETTKEAGVSETAQQEPEKEEPRGPRPTSSVPVPGTPWMVVWTSDRRQFFFDVTSRVSLWMMPEELKDNPLVEKIIDDGPDGEAPSAKRVKVEGEGGEEDEEEMEGGELDISVGGEDVATMKMVQTEAVDAEKKAAMIRSGKTLEERQEEFKEMLLERAVSAFSTWDKELPKFVFDPRYMLLSSKERKSCFEEFIRSRAEEERKERRSKLKARRDEFRKLLEDSKLHPKSSFSEFAQRHARDERFKAVEKMREREQLFSDYLQELKKTVAASSSAGRGRQRGGDRTAHDHTSSSPHLKPTDKVKAEFVEMLSEDGSLSESSQWRKVKGGLERDTRYRAVSSGSSQREEWFLEYIKSLATGSTGKAGTADPSREREERIQASLKEREREVQMSRSAQEKEWGRERDQLRRSEALQQFKAMLADTIRSIGVSWNDARRQLRQDSRWASMGLLEAEEKEKLYQEHCDSLVEKKRLQFRRLLEETSQISLVMPWKKARKLIREDPRYKNFAESDHRREAEYDKHLRDKMVMAKNEFRGLLRETKIITYKLALKPPCGHFHFRFLLFPLFVCLFVSLTFSAPPPPRFVCMCEGLTGLLGSPRSTTRKLSRC